MPPARKNRKGPTGLRRSSRMKDGHPPADLPDLSDQTCQKTESRHDRILEIISKNLSPNVRQNLTVRQIFQLLSDCQVRIKRCTVIVDISSDNEDLIGIAVERKPPNQFFCRRCNDSFSWRPNEEYLGKKPGSIKTRPGSSSTPAVTKLQFKMNCNCSQL